MTEMTADRERTVGGSGGGGLEAGQTVSDSEDVRRRERNSHFCVHIFIFVLHLECMNSSV